MYKRQVLPEPGDQRLFPLVVTDLLQQRGADPLDQPARELAADHPLVDHPPRVAGDREPLDPDQAELRVHRHRAGHRAVGVGVRVDRVPADRPEPGTAPARDAVEREGGPAGARGPGGGLLAEGCFLGVVRLLPVRPLRPCPLGRATPQCDAGRVDGVAGVRHGAAGEGARSRGARRVVVEHDLDAVAGDAQRGGRH